jgi:hypothetical protein
MRLNEKSGFFHLLKSLLMVYLDPTDGDRKFCNVKLGLNALFPQGETHGVVLQSEWIYCR